MPKRKPRKAVAVHDRAQKFATSVPIKFRAGYLKAAAGACSARASLKAKCLECSCYVVAEVADCRVHTCPLWPVRPYQDAMEARQTPVDEGSGVVLDPDDPEAVPPEEAA